MTKEEPPKHENISSALAAAQMEMKPPLKTAENPGFKRDGISAKYADLSSVVESVRKPLTSHGIAWSWRSHNDANGWIWEAVLTHGDSGTELSCSVPVCAPATQSHAFKSGVTYAKRIGLESVTGQAPDDDDDGNEAAKAPPPEKPRQARPPSPPQEAIDGASSSLKSADNLDQLKAIFFGLPREVQGVFAVIKAKDDRKAELQEAAKTQDNERTSDAHPALDDSLPY